LYAKRPGLHREGPGEGRKVNYFVEIGAGAGAGAGACGQQEAANKEATAARIAILAIFIMVGQVWLLSLVSLIKLMTHDGSMLADLLGRASMDCGKFKF
jgi:hypothetical protein